MMHTEMACGVCLGILVICLFQAERVGCQASQGQMSQRLNGQYVGIGNLQRDSRYVDGSYPQNQLRRVFSSPLSSQSSSFNSQSKANSGYSQGHYNNVQTLSQQAHSSLNSAKNKWFSKPRLQTDQDVQAPKKRFQLSEVASGASLFQSGSKTNQRAKHAGQKQPSLPWPEKTWNQASQQSALMTPHRAAGNSPASSSQKETSYPFGLEQILQRGPARMKLSAASPGRKVTKSSTSQISPQKGSSWDFGKNLKLKSKNKAFSSKSVLTPTQKAQYRFHSGTDDIGSFAASQVINIPERFGGFAIKRLKSPNQQPSRVAPQQPSRVAPQQPSRVAPQQPSRVAPQQPSRVAPQQPSRVAPQTKWKLVRLGAR